MSEITEIFIELNQHFTKIFNQPMSLLTVTEAQKVMDSLKSRSKMVLTPLHYAANILDPAYRGCQLTSTEVALGIEIIRKVGMKFGISENKLLIEIVHYNSQSGLWSHDYVKQSYTLVNAID